MNETMKIGELDCTVKCASGSPKAAAIICHGFGAGGTDLVPIADELVRAVPALADIAFIFPAAPIELDPMFDSRAWWMIDIDRIQKLMATGEFRELRSSNPPELPSRRQEIESIIKHAKDQYDLAADKIILGGFSQGSMLATDVALHHDETLGGLIVWSGTLLNEVVWTAAAKEQKPLRVIQSHGYTDPILPFAGAEFLRDMLNESGHDVQFIPFQGEHTIGVEALVAVAKFMTEFVEA